MGLVIRVRFVFMLVLRIKARFVIVITTEKNLPWAYLGHCTQGGDTYFKALSLFVLPYQKLANEI